MKWMLNPMFFFTHWFYARWKHGKKATVPMMHLAGFPITQKTNKLCSPEYCQDKESLDEETHQPVSVDLEESTFKER